MTTIQCKPLLRLKLSLIHTIGEDVYWRGLVLRGTHKVDLALTFLIRCIQVDLAQHGSLEEVVLGAGGVLS
jgi:hypothetical protein